VSVEVQIQHAPPTVRGGIRGGAYGARTRLGLLDGLRLDHPRGDGGLVNTLWNLLGRWGGNIARHLVIHDSRRPVGFYVMLLGRRDTQSENTAIARGHVAVPLAAVPADYHGPRIPKQRNNGAQPLSINPSAMHALRGPT
jgi:hypothetical protein